MSSEQTEGTSRFEQLHAAVHEQTKPLAFRVYRELKALNSSLSEDNFSLSEDNLTAWRKNASELAIKSVQQHQEKKFANKQLADDTFVLRSTLGISLCRDQYTSNPAPLSALRSAIFMMTAHSYATMIVELRKRIGQPAIDADYLTSMTVDQLCSEVIPARFIRQVPPSHVSGGSASAAPSTTAPRWIPPRTGSSLDNPAGIPPEERVEELPDDGRSPP